MVAAAAATRCPTASVLYVVPSDADLDGAVADVRFFLAALEGLSESAGRARGPAVPSHEVDPYRGLAPHVGVTSARAARAARAGERHGARRRRVGGGAAAARQRARHAAERVDRT